MSFVSPDWSFAVSNVINGNLDLNKWKQFPISGAPEIRETILYIRRLDYLNEHKQKSI